MDLYIIELLKDKNRIIIPAFGVFIKSRNNSNDVVFNEFLKYNDGVLENFIQQKENVSSQEALEKIKNYVKKIVETLESGKAYKIGSIGEIFKNESGKITLKTSTEQEATANVISKVGAEKKEPTQVNPPNKIKKDVQQDKENSPTVVGQEKKEIRTNQAIPRVEKKSVYSPSPPLENPSRYSTISPNASNLKEPSAQSPSSIYEKNDDAYNYESKKKKKAFIITIVILLLLILGISIYLLKKNEENPVVILKESAPESIEEKDTIQKGVTAGLGANETKQAATGIVTKYYLVAGCFKIENNAEKLYNQLQQKGYLAEKFHYKNNLYMVTYGSFETKQEVLEEYKKLNSQNITTWIYKIKNYHIIGGCFKYKNNVNRFLANLKTKGYNNSKEIGKIGRLHFVSYETLNDRKEAIEILQNNYLNHGIDAWVFRY